MTALQPTERIGDYRSINKVPTALGIERKLCVVIGVIAACNFQLTKQFLESLSIFAAFWCAVFFLHKWEPRIIKMLPDLWQERSVYCPRKFVG